MPNNTKLVSSGANNIFLQNSFILVLQFPFENPATVESFKHLLAKRGLKLQKVSKSDLFRQLSQMEVAFVPTLGANFILVHENPEKTVPRAQWNDLFSLMQQHQANILFCKNKESKDKTTFWYDNKRFLEHSALSAQPPFSSHLFRMLQTKTVLPLLTNNVLPILRLLNREK